MESSLPLMTRSKSSRICKCRQRVRYRYEKGLKQIETDTNTVLQQQIWTAPANNLIVT